VADDWCQKLVRKLRSIVGGSTFDEASKRENASVVNIQMTFDLTRPTNPNLGLPPHAVPGLSTIKELVRKLKYKTVDELVGLKVELSSLERVEEELRIIIQEHGIQLDETVSNSGVFVFLKYGFLDIEFAVRNTALVPEVQRVRFLKEMGFLPDKEFVDDSIFHDAGLGFLEEMLEEAREGKLLFKIKLDSVGSYRGAHGVSEEKLLKESPAQYFPCEFIVRDACLTNCGLIWLNKHFYL
jgi:hypothetical protein